MLVLSRQRDESIIIGDNIVVTIVDIRGDKVRLGINAPTEIPVHRQEIYEAIQRENLRACARRAERHARAGDARRVEKSEAGRLIATSPAGRRRSRRNYRGRPRPRLRRAKMPLCRLRAAASTLLKPPSHLYDGQQHLPRFGQDGEEFTVSATKTLIRVGHSPDPDDAFMFHALANHKIDTGQYEFRHELVDIETLNRRAFSGELELTAVSLHAYAHLNDRYLLCPCGASMGDGYGPMVIAKHACGAADLRKMTIAVPGTLTTAYLALRLCLGLDFEHVVVPFDQIIAAVENGRFGGQPIDAGLIIHEGQLTYADRGLTLIVDTGKWWLKTTGLPLPLGANAIRKDLGPTVIRDVNRLLKQSIEYGLAHRDEALAYALQYGRDLDRSRADRFVGMYVNDWTLDFGPRGREAVRVLLARGNAAGVIPKLVSPEFVED